MEGQRGVKPVSVVLLLIFLISGQFASALVSDYVEKQINGHASAPDDPSRTQQQLLGVCLAKCIFHGKNKVLCAAKCIPICIISTGLVKTTDSCNLRCSVDRCVTFGDDVPKVQHCVNGCTSNACMGKRI